MRWRSVLHNVDSLPYNDRNYLLLYVPGLFLFPMATINLAPGTQYIAAIRRRRRFLYGISTMIVVAVVLVWAGLFIMNQASARSIQEAQGELSALERRIAEAGPDVE